jgi:all-trans-retinol 13,14-reductase
MYIVLKENQFPYLNHNHHHFNAVNTWTTDYNEKEWPEHYMLYTPPNSQSEKWANALIVITYMKYNEVKKWEHTFVEQRGDEYLEFKSRKAEKLLDFVEKKFPQLRAKIKSCYTSTPLTYRDYTNTHEGSAYGIIKKFHDPISTIIKPKTRIRNLYFTGQNLNMHGVLGVSIGAALTCAELVGSQYLFNKIKNS